MQKTGYRYHKVVQPPHLQFLNPLMPEDESDSLAPSQGGESVIPSSTTQSEDRTALLERARTFLASPQVRAQNAAEQRAFLHEKGLDAKEVTQVLAEVVCYGVVFLDEVNADVPLAFV